MLFGVTTDRSDKTPLKRNLVTDKRAKDKGTDLGSSSQQGS